MATFLRFAQRSGYRSAGAIDLVHVEKPNERAVSHVLGRCCSRVSVRRVCLLRDSVRAALRIAKRLQDRVSETVCLFPHIMEIFAGHRRMDSPAWMQAGISLPSRR